METKTGEVLVVPLYLVLVTTLRAIEAKILP